MEMGSSRDIERGMESGRRGGGGKESYNVLL